MRAITHIAEVHSRLRKREWSIDLECFAVADGLELTFSVLAKTQNEAAVRVLLDALDSQDRDVQVGALRAMLARRSPTAQRELLDRWHTLSKRWKRIVADSGGQLSNAIRDAILSPDEQLHQNGCDAVLTLREYDLIPLLVTAAEDTSIPRAEKSAETLLLLADSLCEELAAPRDYQNRRDPRVALAHVTGTLEQSVARFDQHKCREIVEAFLMLVGNDNPVLHDILHRPHDKAFLTLVNLLSNSPRRGVMRLILDALDDPRSPSVVYGILARRKDVSFVRHMLRRFSDDVPKSVQRNLKRIDSFSWLRDDMNLLSALNGEEQRGAIHLIMASGMSRLRAFDVIDFILTHGATEGRREAAVALNDFRGEAASASVVRALEDNDPLVRATAVRQLRERGTRRAMPTLLDLIDSPHEAVREAARESLAEFTFERFLATFGTLDNETLAETGRFVKRVDPLALEGLRSELQSPIRVRRIRAIQMAVAMKAVSEVEPLLIELIYDEDHIIRAAAAEALVESPSAASRTALRNLILDRSEIVRDSAERTLQIFAERESPPNSEPGPLLWDLIGTDPAVETGEAM